MGEEKEKQGLKGYIISFIFSSLCSIALPVGLSFYFAPEKSLAYFQDTVQDKVDAVTGIELDHVRDLALNIAREIPPMLQMEYDVLFLLTENVPPALRTTSQSVILLDYRITLSIVAATAIAGFFFPFQECKDWLINVVWGSICIVAGFLPLDSGMEVLADKEAGVYRMTVMICSVIVVLAANYLTVIIGWWLLGKIISVLYRILSKPFRGNKGKITKNKTTKLSEESAAADEIASQRDN